MVIQAQPDALDGLPDRVFIGEGLSLRVSVDGRKPLCFECGQKGHVLSKCEPKNAALLQRKRPKIYSHQK